MNRRLFQDYLIFAVVALISIGVGLAARPSPAATAHPSETRAVIARIGYADESDLRQLVSRLDVWEVHKADRYMVAQLQPAEYLRLLTHGYHVEVDAAKTARLNQPRTILPGQTNGIPGYPCYRIVEETYTAAQNIVAAHPTLAQWIDIGDSWDKTASGGTAGSVAISSLWKARMPRELGSAHSSVRVNEPRGYAYPSTNDSDPVTN